MKRYFIKAIRLLPLITLLLSLITPFMVVDTVNAYDKKGATNLTIGDKVVFGKNVVGEYQGLDSKGRAIFKSTIDAPKYIDAKGTAVATQWIKQGTTYVTKNNLFNALVTGTTVKVTYGAESLQWNPTVIIGGKTIDAGSSQLAPVDPINGNYYFNTIQWQYGIMYRNLRQIEGVLSEYYTLYFEPSGDIEIKENKIKSKGFTNEREVWAIDADNKPIKITDTGNSKIVKLSDLKGVKYPVTIDPTSTYYTSASDGYYEDTNASYNTIHDTATAGVRDTSWDMHIGQGYNYSLYFIGRSFVYFDTSDLPDGATITSATLSIILGYDIYIDTDFNVVISNGMPTYPHEPMQSSDYLYSNYSGNGGSLTTVGMVEDAYSDIALNATGIGWINDTGITKLALLSSRDISKTTPTGFEMAIFYSYEKGEGFRPKLVVTYTANVPTITTGTASSILTTSANVSSTLVATGGADVTKHGIQYGTASATYTANTSVSGNYTAGTLYNGLTGLTKGTTYFYRAFAENSAGYGYGAESSFNTLGDPAIDTDSATLVTLSSARLNATLSSDGGNTDNVSVRWGWGKVSQTAVNFANYTVLTAWTNSYGSGDHPYLDLTSLNSTETYYYRIQAVNISGTVTSATEQSFTVSSSVAVPTQFIALPVSGTEIDLTWITGTGASSTYIIYKVNSQPSDNRSDGIHLVTATGNSYEHTGLTAGNTYFYRAWGKDGTTYSATSTTGQATTLTASTSTGSLPSASEPDGWFLTPAINTDITTKNPIGSVINNFADAIDLTQPITWFLVAMFISMILTFITYRITHHIMATMIMACVTLGVGTTQGFVPSFLTGLVVIASILTGMLREKT